MSEPDSEIIVIIFTFTGSLLPPMYTSDRNELILWMKTNEDTVVGNGFELMWETVDPWLKYFADIKVVYNVIHFLNKK